jgi:hypothetical protein
MTHFSKLMLTAGLSALLGATVAVAQNQTEVADIPFAFHAAEMTLPAGQYTVLEQSAGGLFQVRGADGRSIYVSMHPGKTSNPDEPKLTFVHDGEDYVLKGVSMNGHTEGWESSQSAIEKNLSRKLGVATMIAVPLRAR